MMRKKKKEEFYSDIERHYHRITYLTGDFVKATRLLNKAISKFNRDTEKIITKLALARQEGIELGKFADNNNRCQRKNG